MKIIIGKLFGREHMPLAIQIEGLGFFESKLEQKEYRPFPVIELNVEQMIKLREFINDKIAEYD